MARQIDDLDKIAVGNSRTGIPRREVLRRAAVLMGGSLSAPAVLGVLAGRSAQAVTATPAPGQLLAENQFALVSEITEIMIPRTDTPGARDVGVPAFVDDMLANVYSADAQQRFLGGLGAFQDEVRERTGQAFLSSRPSDARRRCNGPTTPPSTSRRRQPSAHSCS